MNWTVLFGLAGVAIGIVFGAHIAGQGPRIGARDTEALTWQIKAATEGRPIQVCKVYR